MSCLTFSGGTVACACAGPANKRAIAKMSGLAIRTNIAARSCRARRIPGSHLANPKKRSVLPEGRQAADDSGLRGPRAASAGCRTGGAERLVHHVADGERAAAALGAAAETAIDLAGRAPPPRRDGGADIPIGQHIARTDDHGAMVLDGDVVWAGSVLARQAVSSPRRPVRKRKASPETATWQSDGNGR